MIKGKMMNRLSVALFVLGMALVIYGCGTLSENKAPASNNDTGTVLVMDHFGYDFSAQIATGDYSVCDGHTIMWCPVSTNINYASYAQYTWYTNDFFNSPNYTTQIKDYGMVSLNTITAGPVSWNMDPIDPLFVGHAYVARCHDGYVAFEVMAIGSANIPEATSANFMPVKIRYKYSTSINF